MVNSFVYLFFSKQKYMVVRCFGCWWSHCEWNSPTTFKHDKKKTTTLWYQVQYRAFSDCYFCAIAIYLIIDSKRWHFYSMSMYFLHTLVHNFTQHSGSNWLRENLGSLCFGFYFLFLSYFLFIFLSCIPNPSSILLLTFSLKLLSYISTIHTPSVFAVVYP